MRRGVPPALRPSLCACASDSRLGIGADSGFRARGARRIDVLETARGLRSMIAVIEGDPSSKAAMRRKMMPPKMLRHELARHEIDPD